MSVSAHWQSSSTSRTGSSLRRHGGEQSAQRHQAAQFAELLWAGVQFRSRAQCVGQARHHAPERGGDIGDLRVDPSAHVGVGQVLRDALENATKQRVRALAGKATP